MSKQQARSKQILLRWQRSTIRLKSVEYGSPYSFGFRLEIMSKLQFQGRKVTA